MRIAYYLQVNEDRVTKKGSGLLREKSDTTKRDHDGDDIQDCKHILAKPDEIEKIIQGKDQESTCKEEPGRLFLDSAGIAADDKNHEFDHDGYRGKYFRKCHA